VRTWRVTLAENGRSEIRIVKAYKLLRAILNTTADDGRIKRNPCRIKGADQEYSPERPVASVPQVYALADQMPPRFRVFVLAAAFTGLRWGELIALRRCDVDTDEQTIRVPRRLAQLNSRQMVAGPTKSEAGFRTVALPELIVDDVCDHLTRFAKLGDSALIFVATPATTWRPRPEPPRRNSCIGWDTGACGPRSSISTPQANATRRSRRRSAGGHVWHARRPRRKPRTSPMTREKTVRRVPPHGPLMAHAGC